MSTFLAQIASPFLSRNLRNLVLQRGYREIVKEEDGKKITIKGLRTQLDTSNYVKPDDDVAETCPLASRNIQVTYEDVLILNQFITSDGKILQRHETSLSMREYYKVKANVLMAQRSGLLPRPTQETEFVDIKGNKIPRYERHLTRYEEGTRSPFRGRGVWYAKRWHMIGDRRNAEDAPHISNNPLRIHH